ncbi:DNA ligase [Marinomonas sp.]
MMLRMCACILTMAFSAVLYGQYPVALAKVYDDKVVVSDYLVSEKYDGIRAIWTGSELLTRTGKTIHAPAWFTKGLPNLWLDGELWSKRQDFAFIQSTVSKQTPVDQEWRKLHYMVFDAPDKNRTFTFEQRVSRYTRILQQANLSHVIPVEQFTVTDKATLFKLLDEYVAKGAEGLMLHLKTAQFSQGRSDHLLKLKPYMDAEAIVLDVLPGKGKYEGQMGSLLVELPSGIRFKIGTGFSDKERLSPPSIGSRVTFRYHGFTNNGVPRFASFLRVRP